MSDNAQFLKLSMILLIKSNCLNLKNLTWRISKLQRKYSKKSTKILSFFLILTYIIGLTNFFKKFGVNNIKVKTVRTKCTGINLSKALEYLSRIAQISTRFKRYALHRDFNITLIWVLFHYRTKVSFIRQFIALFLKLLTN